jgi:hypothetical protein
MQSVNDTTETQFRSAFLSPEKQPQLIAKRIVLKILLRLVTVAQSSCSHPADRGSSSSGSSSSLYSSHC